MCGRFTHLFSWQQLHRLMSLVSPEVTLPLRFNVAPTQLAPVIVHDEVMMGAALRSMRWGLVPSWAKDFAIGNSLINARAEGIDSKPSFRAAFQRRRCVVPVSGFFEWQKVEGSRKKQPYYITPAAPLQRDSPTATAESVEPWLLAGLWEAWHNPALSRNSAPLETFTIITTDANNAMAPIHNRMPVILDLATATQWIGPGDGAVNRASSGEDSAAQLLSLLRPCPPERMAFHRVSTLVNSPRHDSAQCIQESSGEGFGSLFDQRD
jgi:putative SOS response-associated peptidase YedK